MSQRRYEITDEWSIMEPLLNKPRGVARSDDRTVLNGIFVRTGSPWADIPERYGPSTTCALFGGEN